MKTQKPKQPRNDLASAEARAAEKSRLAYRETPSRFTRDEILRRRDAAAYEGTGIAPPLRTAKDPTGNVGTPDPNDLSSREARGETDTSAYGSNERAPFRAQGPYVNPEVGDLPKPDVDEDMKGRVAAAQAADLDPFTVPAQSLEDAEEANRRRSAAAYLRPWGSK